MTPLRSPMRLDLCVKVLLPLIEDENGLQNAVLCSHWSKTISLLPAHLLGCFVRRLYAEATTRAPLSAKLSQPPCGFCTVKHF